MKKHLYWITITLLVAGVGCKHKKSSEKKEDFFPVSSFIKSQVAEIDTSLNSIKKITYIDSMHSDTEYVPREQFKNLAKDFLDIPDLADKKYKDRYTEEKLFDETLNRAIITYKPVNPDKEELQKQEVLITPDPSGDKVSSIFLDWIINNKDGFLQRKLLWEVDKSFQVTTISQKPSQPETTSILKVTWDENKE